MNGIENIKGSHVYICTAPRDTLSRQETQTVMNDVALETSLAVILLLVGDTYKDQQISSFSSPRNWSDNHLKEHSYSNTSYQTMSAITISATTTNPTASAIFAELVASGRFDDVMMNYAATLSSAQQPVVGTAPVTTNVVEVVNVDETQVEETEPTKKRKRATKSKNNSAEPRSLKRKAEEPAGREFTTEEFVETLIKNHLVVTGVDTDICDLASIRDTFEKVLEEHYSITRGAKSIIAKHLKPTMVNTMIVEKVTEAGGSYEKSLKINVDPITYLALAPAECHIDDFKDTTGSISLKNVFTGVRMEGPMHKIVPCAPRKPRGKAAATVEATQNVEATQDVEESGNDEADEALASASKAFGNDGPLGM